MIPYFLLTFDVEDWFQVENLKSCFPFPVWSACELRIEKNVHRILDLLDSVILKDKKENPFFTALNGEKSIVEKYSSISEKFVPSATFFILGWIAERLPHLVREIYSRGHEIASHGNNHRLIGLMCLPFLFFKLDHWRLNNFESSEPTYRN